MDTDIVAGVESGLERYWSEWSTDRDQVERFPYKPDRILGSVADIKV